MRCEKDAKACGKSKASLKEGSSSGSSLSSYLNHSIFLSSHMGASLALRSSTLTSLQEWIKCVLGIFLKCPFATQIIFFMQTSTFSHTSNLQNESRKTGKPTTPWSLSGHSISVLSCFLMVSVDNIFFYFHMSCYSRRYPGWVSLGLTFT